MNYKISVIVPVYNVENYIRECIESIVNQTYKNLEIILVDDGSTDNSGKVCDEYAATDERITVIHKQNAGLISARKAGISMATGDYATYVDSDDWIDYDTYERAAEMIDKYSPDMVVYGYKKCNGDEIYQKYEELEDGYYTRHDLYNLIKNEFEINNIFYKNLLSSSCCNKIVRLDLLKRNQLTINEKIIIGEDAALSFSCLIESNDIYIMHSTPYNYRVRRDSIMHKNEQNQYESVILVAKHLYAVMKNSRLLYNDIIFHQFILYIFYEIIISDIKYFIKDIKVLYPKLKKNSKILIYGEGVFSRNLSEWLRKNNYCEITGYIKTSSILKLSQYNGLYDYIIIAVANAVFVKDIIDLLRSVGISDKKILYIKNYDLTADKLPDSLKFDDTEVV